MSPSKTGLPFTSRRYLLRVMPAGIVPFPGGSSSQKVVRIVLAWLWIREQICTLKNIVCTNVTSQSLIYNQAIDCSAWAGNTGKNQWGLYFWNFNLISTFKILLYSLPFSKEKEIKWKTMPEPLDQAIRVWERKSSKSPLWLGTFQMQLSQDKATAPQSSHYNVIITELIWLG